MSQSTATTKTTSDSSKSRFNKILQNAARRAARQDTDLSDSHSVASHSTNRKISKSQLESRYGFGGKPMLQLQNTFRTQPEAGQTFNEKEIRDVCERVLHELLDGMSYNHQSAPNLTRTISNTVKDKVKMLNMPRYKFIVSTVIGEQAGQSVKSASRCLWNAATDSWTSARYESATLFAMVSVHGVYLD